MSEKTSARQQARFDIFISHSKHDKPVADAVVHTLEGRGWRCWIAPRDITPGLSWSEGIIDGLDASRVFVLIFSSNANQSQHVLREVERAISKSRIVIPFRIEDVPPSRALEYCISLPHWLDALTPPLQGHIDRLAETVAVIGGIPDADSTQGESVVAPPVANPPSPGPVQSPSSEESPLSEDVWQRQWHALVRTLDAGYQTLKRSGEQANRRLRDLMSRCDRRRLHIGTVIIVVGIVVFVCLLMALFGPTGELAVAAALGAIAAVAAVLLYIMWSTEIGYRRQIIQRVQEMALRGDVTLALELVEQFNSRWCDVPEWIDVKARLVWPSEESPSSEDAWHRHLHSMARALDDPASSYEFLKRLMDRAKRMRQRLPEHFHDRFMKRLYDLKLQRGRSRLLIGTVIVVGVVVFVWVPIALFSPTGAQAVAAAASGTIAAAVAVVLFIMWSNEIGYRRQIIQHVQEMVASGDVDLARELVKQFDSRWMDVPEWIDLKARLESDKNALAKRQEDIKAILGQAAAVPDTDDVEFERLIEQGATLMMIGEPGTKQEFELASGKLKVERAQKRLDSAKRRARDLADAGITIERLQHDAPRMADDEFEQWSKRLHDWLNELRGDPDLDTRQRTEIDIQLSALRETTRKRQDDRRANVIANVGAAVKALQNDAPLMADVEFWAQRKALRDQLNMLHGGRATDRNQRSEIELQLIALGEISRQRTNWGLRKKLFADLRSKSHIPRTVSAPDAFREYASTLSKAAEACKSTDSQFAEDLLKTADEEADWKALYEAQEALPSDADHLLPTNLTTLGKLDERLKRLLSEHPSSPLTALLTQYAELVSARQRCQTAIADLETFLREDRMKRWHIVRETTKSVPYYLKDSEEVASGTINRMQANGSDVPTKVRGNLQSSKPAPAPQTRLAFELEKIARDWTTEEWVNVCQKLVQATFRATDVDPILRLIVLKEVLETSAKGDPELKNQQAFQRFELELRLALHERIGADIDWADPISAAVAGRRKQAEDVLNEASTFDAAAIWETVSSVSANIARALCTRYEAVGCMFPDEKNQPQLHMTPLPRGSSEIFASVPDVEDASLIQQRHHFVVVGHRTADGQIKPTADLQKHYKPGRLVFQSLMAN